MQNCKLNLLNLEIVQEYSKVAIKMLTSVADVVSFYSVVAEINVDFFF